MILQRCQQLLMLLPAVKRQAGAHALGAPLCQAHEGRLRRAGMGVHGGREGREGQACAASTRAAGQRAGLPHGPGIGKPHTRTQVWLCLQA